MASVANGFKGESGNTLRRSFSIKEEEDVRADWKQGNDIENKGKPTGHCCYLFLE